MNYTELAKSIAMYGLTSAMAVLATRYHLSGDQVMAITSDIVGGAAVLGGIYMHNAAAVKGDKKS